MHELLLCCESSRKCRHAAQRLPTWTKTMLTCFTKLIAVQPSMAEYEWMYMYQMKVELTAIMQWNQFVMHTFQTEVDSWEIWKSNRMFAGHSLTQYCMHFRFQATWRPPLSIPGSWNHVSRWASDGSVKIMCTDFNTMSKALYHHCVVPRKGLKAVGPLVACLFYGKFRECVPDCKNINIV